MIVSIVDHGGARRSTNATAASVERAAQHEDDRQPGEKCGDATHAKRRRALAEPSDDRAHDRVDGGCAREQEPDLGRGHAVRLQLERHEQVDATADEADEHDDRDAGEDELVPAHDVEDLAQGLRGARP